MEEMSTTSSVFDTSLKRINDSSQNNRARPRSPTVSYRTDADSEIMNDGGLDGLDEIDRKILSAAILDVDITEEYSPESSSYCQEVRITGRVVNGFNQRLGLQS